MKKVFVEGNTLREVEVDDEYEDTGIYDDKHPHLKEECIDGVVYAMATGSVKHGIVMGNIFGAIKHALRGKHCRVFDGTLEYHYRADDPERREIDYVQPDVMICCEEKALIKNGYYAAPKFVVEVLSPGTQRYDKKKKFGVYEEAGVEEFWIVHPQGILDIYYLVDGHYKLHDTWTLEDDKAFNDYNADEVITLRCFPDIKMTLGEIFE